jgi:hypothetical protein
MRIDRQNYEEFFLLYVDNELNVEQKKQVELFVFENPDLEEELVMLRQSKLVPDSAVIFPDKFRLTKHEEEQQSITLDNYEEWFVMWTDHELNLDQRTMVEKFLLIHPGKRAELEKFAQTKLEPEEILFPGKSDLYKHSSSRVISISWWRVAVAAVVVIAASIFVYSALSTGNRRSGGPIPMAKTRPLAPVTPGIPARKEQVLAPVGEQIASRRGVDGVVPNPKKANGAAIQHVRVKEEDAPALAQSNESVPTRATPVPVSLSLTTPLLTVHKRIRIFLTRQL